MQPKAAIIVGLTLNMKGPDGWDTPLGRAGDASEAVKWLVGACEAKYRTERCAWLGLEGDGFGKKGLGDWVSGLGDFGGKVGLGGHFMNDSKDFTICA